MSEETAARDAWVKWEEQHRGDLDAGCLTSYDQFAAGWEAVSGAAGDREFLTRLLRVTADDDELDPAEYEFAVITAGRGEGRSVTYWPWEKGEVVAVPLEDLGSRDLREGRSFAKYDVREERFGRDWEAAKRRSDEVKAGPDVDMFARAGQGARP